MNISVCIATYNGQQFIKDQINSVLKQLSANDEIIISDDDSNDSTLKFIESFNDRRIKIFKNNKSKGYTNNFINAIEKSSNELIFLCDQDDVWMDNKVDICRKYISEGYQMVISNAEVVDQDLNILSESYFRTRNTKFGFFNNLVRVGYLGCTLAFNKSILKGLYPFPENKKLIPHDLWIGMYGMLFYKVKWTNIPLIKYRRHSSNVSDGGFEVSKLSLINKFKLRAILILNLIYRKR